MMTTNFKKSVDEFREKCADEIRFIQHHLNELTEEEKDLALDDHYSHYVNDLKRISRRLQELMDEEYYMPRSNNDELICLCPIAQELDELRESEVE